MSETKILTKEIAEKFLKGQEAETLSSFTLVEDAAAQALAQHEGRLWLNGLTSLSERAAQALADHEGDLDLNGLTCLSDAAAEALAKHQGDLDLDGLTSLSDSPGHVALACKLARKTGWLPLRSLKNMSESAAEALAQHEGHLLLDGLTGLSDAAAVALGRHTGELTFRGLTSLSDSAAEALACHRGTIELARETSLSEAAAAALEKPATTEAPPQYRDGVLKLPRPARPVKGAGNDRVHWRLVISYSKNLRVFKATSSNLQKWFYQLLPEPHKTQQKDYYVSREAWKLFMDHLEFWRLEATRWNEGELRARAEKKEKEKASKAREAREKERRLATTASVAGLPTGDLKAKLNRLGEMIRGGNHAIARELIQVGDPWFLQALLDGCRASGVEYQLNVFFDHPDASDLFWLTAALAREQGCCPREVDVESVSRMTLSAGTRGELDLILRHVLTAFENLEELELSLGGFSFSTAELPVMRRMSSLWLRGSDDFSTDIAVESLERQSALRALFVNSLGGLQVSGDQLAQLHRVRLECGTGSYSLTGSGLRSLRQRPEARIGCNHEGIRCMNDAALEAFLHMQRDWSGKLTRPDWWRASWSQPDVLSRIFGRVDNFEWPEEEDAADCFVMTLVDAAGRRHLHQCPLGHNNAVGMGTRVAIDEVIARRLPWMLDLSDEQSAGFQLSEQQAALIAGADVPVRIGAKSLTAEVARQLGSFKAELHLVGSLEADRLAPLMKSRCVLLEVEFENLGPGALEVLAGFQGAALALRLSGRLKAQQAEVLRAYSGELRLVGSNYRKEVHLDMTVAEILCQRKAPVKLDESMRLTVDAIERLARRPDIDLRSHRWVCRRPSQRGDTNVTVVRYFAPNAPKMNVIRSTRRGPAGAERISEQAFHRSSGMVPVVGKLLEQGYLLESPTREEGRGFPVSAGRA